jgi:hypothetical protein
MGPSKELAEIQTSADHAIDRNRNLRQKTLLLSYAREMIRERFRSLRSGKEQASRSLQETRERVRLQLKAAPGKPAERGEEKPVNVRTIPSA